MCREKLAGCLRHRALLSDTEASNRHEVRLMLDGFVIQRFVFDCVLLLVVVLRVLTLVVSQQSFDWKMLKKTCTLQVDGFLFQQYRLE